MPADSRRVEWRRGGGQANGFHRVSPFERRGKMAIRPFTPFPPPPLKFRTVGFPQYGFKLAPATATFAPRAYRPPLGLLSECGVCSVVGFRQSAPHPSDRPTSPVALGSASGYSVRQPHRLLWPHPRLWSGAPAYGLFPARSPVPELPQFTPRVYSDRVASRTPAVPSAAFDCCLAAGAAFAVSASARQPQCQTFRTGLNGVTRLQNSLHAATRSFCLPCPGQDFYDRASTADVAIQRRRLSLHGFQSIPVTGLSPARLMALWAASGRSRSRF